MRLVFAEDNYIVREGTAALLARRRPDVVRTDIRMPSAWTTEGVDAARRIRQEDTGVGVVVLAQYAEDASARTRKGE